MTRAAVVGEDKEYDRIFDEFRRALESGRDPDPRAFWQQYQGPADRRHWLLLELIEQEIYFRICKEHRPVWVPEFARQHPELTAEDLHELLAQAQDYERRVLAPALAGPAEGEGPCDAGHPTVPGFRNWKRLAHGAMGVVWQAERIDLPSVTEAFKVPHAQVLKFIGRVALLNEARAAVRVKHANVCRIHEVCETWPYMRMEYVAGKTLEAWCREVRPPLTILAGKFALIARAVHAIHRAGIIHRDLKPANQNNSSRALLRRWPLG
jgi:hypothetical protein